MASTLLTPPPSFYLVGDRGPESFRPGMIVRLEPHESIATWCRVGPQESWSYSPALHDGEWFVRSGERQAARANRIVGFILAMVYVALLVLA